MARGEFKRENPRKFKQSKEFKAIPNNFKTIAIVAKWVVIWLMVIWLVVILDKPARSR
jgi:uncharacterized membrane protein SpoIIM required for sporulation